MQIKRTLTRRRRRGRGRRTQASMHRHRDAHRYNSTLDTGESLTRANTKIDRPRIGNATSHRRLRSSNDYPVRSAFNATRQSFAIKPVQVSRIDSTSQSHASHGVASSKNARWESIKHRLLSAGYAAIKLSRTFAYIFHRTRLFYDSTRGPLDKLAG